ncbi:O-antigen ligase family protein [Campylobacter concisus]|uniref:O-antigen ligase family protein n=1 Tax=Campylobacter concisus TaxID=199 RepID=UPI000CD8324B|nr:O-antigen ligase family protein [Campylobacter concisus]
MKNEIASKLYNFFLLVMLFTLPVTEGLKQISLTLFVLVGIYICVKEKRQFKFDVINVSLFIFVLATFISCLVNGVSPSRVLDPLRCMLFFFVARTVGTEKINFKFMFYALFAGFIVAFIPACIEKFSDQDPEAFLILKSIGHVNHSAIYIFLIFLTALLFISNKNKNRSINISISIICILALAIAGSRSTAYMIPLVSVLIFSYLIYKKEVSFKLSLTLSILFCVVFFTYLYITIAFTADERIYDQMSKGVQGGEFRFLIFESAFKTWQDNIFFGIGSGNFKSIDLTHFFPQSAKAHVSHSHNTFLTFLTEKGIIALLAYLVFQLSLFIKFIKNFRQSRIVFLALLMLFFQNVISLVNTTFHHENALLMLLFWALALGVIDEKNSIFKN